MRCIMSSVSTHKLAQGPAPGLRVGKIPYLNSEPFYYGLNGAGLELYSLPPRALGRMAERGEVDAAPLPLVDYFHLAERFEPLGDFCIATRREARSVLLFSRKPLEALDGATIAITGETSTSVQLLKVLLRHRYRVWPRAYVELEESCDAFLLIGDQALRHRQGSPGFPHLYDLGEEWYQWTGLPFVFALWVVRKDLPDPDKAALRSVVARALARGLQALDRIARIRGDTGLCPAEVIEYLEGFRYVLGAEEQQAIERFRALMAAL